MKIISKSPTRVDLAGGTLDMWPLYSFLNSAKTINLAIDIYTQANLNIRKDKKIILDATDIPFKKEYQNLEECLSDTEDALSLLRAHIDYWKPEYGFELSTSSQSPVGGGLGGSSSLSVSIAKAFAYVNKKSLSIHELVQIVHNVEARVLKTPTGTQDYIPPALGGVLSIQYSMDAFKVESLQIDEEYFNSQFMLVYTGKPHHSGINNWQVLKSIIEGDRKTFQALQDIKNISEDLYKEIKNKNFGSFESIFSREYIARCQLAEAFSSKEIQRLNEYAKASQMSLKICGAGGGGCVMLWVPAANKQIVKNELSNMGFKVLDAKMTKNANSIIEV